MKTNKKNIIIIISIIISLFFTSCGTSKKPKCESYGHEKLIN